MSKRSGFALVVGIGTYPAQGVQQLPYATQDARAMAEVLTDDELCRFPDDQVRLLVDEDATRDSVVHHLAKWLPDRSRGADVALFYFAGHGMIRKPGAGMEKGFLLPFNADPEDLATRGISMNDVADWIRSIEAKAVIVCLDCCHSGMAIPRGNGAGGPTDRGIKISPAAYQEMSGKGRYIIASCDDGQVSVECPELGHGLFTHHLLEGIRGHGDRDQDGKVGVSELFEHVSERVEEEARTKFNVIQKPWNSASGPGGVWISRVKVRGGGPERKEPPEPSDERLSDASIDEIERRLPDAADDDALRMLVQLARSGARKAVPPILWSLTHKSQEVRQTAGRALRQVGWQVVTEVIDGFIRDGRDQEIDITLDGLSAFEAHGELVTLLKRLVPKLHGRLRNQCLLLLERKQLSLEQENVAAHFRQMESCYTIEKALGQGPLTSTYRASRRDLNLTQVLRVLRPEFVNDPRVVARFLDLGRESVRYVHQNLVLCRDVQSHPKEQLHFVARDYVTGSTLQKMFSTGQTFGHDQVMTIVRKLLEALEPLHRDGALHGSVKPSNIFLTRRERVVLGDRGIPLQECLSVDRRGYDFQYAAPEICMGEESVGPRADFYSVGCVAYELLCGRPPFESSTALKLIGLHPNKEISPPSSLVSTITEHEDELVMRLLSKDPAERFESPEQALAAIAEMQKVKLGSPPERLSETLIKGTVMDRFEDSILSLGPLTTNLQMPQPLQLPTTGSKNTDLPEELSRRGYELQEEIGRGGQAVVYKAIHVPLEREVAIKILSPQHQQVIARFQREARVLAQLSHAHILPIYDFFDDQGILYLVMPHCTGGTLTERIRKATEENTQLEPLEVINIASAMARALEHAHAMGILHRDIKPGNILFDSAGVALLCDFGLASVLMSGDQEITQTGDVFGTPAFMSPEQLSGHHVKLDGGTDVWSLGATIYEALTGKHPFTAPTREGLYRMILCEKPDLRLRGRLPGIPRGLEAILKNMLKKDMKARPSAQEIGNKLDALLKRHGPE